MLGILAVNVAGFAGPPAAVFTPRAVLPQNVLSDWLFAGMLVLFEGKMRALFSILFGASMLLFVERAEERGQDGAMLQLRRLGWLALFGYLHFALLWWGDILFLYAVAGAIALAFRPMPRMGLLVAALVAFLAWQAHGIASQLPSALAEHRVTLGTASPAEAALHARADRQWNARAEAELQHERMGFAAQVQRRLTKEPFEPVRGALFFLGETLPYMAFGMLLYASGFFAGGWPARRLRWLAIGGIGIGGAITAAFAGWALAHGFPPMAMVLALNHALALPHLAMALGYAALLMLAMERLLATGLGQRLAAAGSVAFSNYIGTTIVMTAIFYGWGLGLVARVPYWALPLFVAAAWTLMLTWSPAWRARFRQGPLEWLWRCLTDWRILPMRIR